MTDPQQVLADRVRDALGAAFGDDYADSDPVIRPSQFADYQSNAALPLAKKLKKRPRDVADEIVARLDLAGIADAPEVSGPGFINLTLSDGWIADQATAVGDDPRLGVPAASDPETVVIEYSSPNIAKEMHVGHLRTTIVGDALARIFEFAGHNVIRDNHVGDWGTPYGMLIEHLIDVGEDSPDARLLRTDPNTFYAAARRKFDSDPGFADRARGRIVKLQAGTDPETRRLWEELVGLSKAYLRDIYGLLRVTLTDDDIRGESFYNHMLADVASELTDKGIAVVSDGALCAFPPGFPGRDGNPLPVIIRKSDGGWNYSSTDLATVKYRVDKMNPGRVLYVVGSEQALHFKMIFATAKLAGWLADGSRFEHAQIGMVQGKDGGRLKTREGDTPKLSALLSESVERARAILDEVEGLDAEAKDAIAEDVGIGALKYADLSTARDSTYTFDFDRMITFKGDTGPYLQYATARIRSIFRRAGIDETTVTGPIVVTEKAERDLALKLLSFGAAISGVIETSEPHRLCGYVFELASLFTTFYEHCPVLKADDETRRSRLALCAATLRVVTGALGLLGVPIPERMLAPVPVPSDSPVSNDSNWPTLPAGCTVVVSAVR
ncbi:MAG: arginine--tRNA ligase [Nocardiopsaceae bacterium]|nr:arginine--tRNA ligase [Nocardiopsaceae bacterium]